MDYELFTQYTHAHQYAPVMALPGYLALGFTACILVSIDTNAY